QDQISAARLRADAAHVHAATAAARGGGSGGPKAAQAELSSVDRAARPHRGDGRHAERDGRPTGKASPLPPRGRTREGRDRKQAAAVALGLSGIRMAEMRVRFSDPAQVRSSLSAANRRSEAARGSTTLVYFAPLQPTCGRPLACSLACWAPNASRPT